MPDNRFSDTMIAARNYGALVTFYEHFVGLSVTDRNEQFTLLADQRTGQTLCVTNGPTVGRAAPAIQTDDVAAAIAQLERLGGKVLCRWEYPKMRGANCADPEGNELLLWQEA